jgi:hypothetical protein
LRRWGGCDGSRRWWRRRRRRRRRVQGLWRNGAKEAKCYKPINFVPIIGSKSINATSDEK